MTIIHFSYLQTVAHSALVISKGSSIYKTKRPKFIDNMDKEISMREEEDFENVSN